MYIAEIHGKLSRGQENKEDILTSNVFSFFKYTPRDIFLFEFIHDLGLSITKKDATQAKFVFWPSYEDHTEPDLVLIIGEYYLLFEAKYLSGFGEEMETIKHQLVREIEGGMRDAKNQGKEFRLIAITAHYYYHPDLFFGVPDRFKDKLIWVNWQRIALLISLILHRQANLSSEVIQFAEDLYTLLVRKRLRNFEGVNVLCNQSTNLHPIGSVFFQAETAKYRGDYLGFTNAITIISKLQPIRGNLFIDDSRSLFINLIDVDQNIQNIGENIFLERRY